MVRKRQNVIIMLFNGSEEHENKNTYTQLQVEDVYYVRNYR